MFYAPVLFKTLGSSDSASLLNTVIVGAIRRAHCSVFKHWRRMWFTKMLPDVVLLRYRRLGLCVKPRTPNRPH